MWGFSSQGSGSGSVAFALLGFWGISITGAGSDVLRSLGPFVGEYGGRV